MTLWYVDNTASGAADGTSWTDAWQSFASITWGGAGVVAGDTLYISGGSASKTYREQLTIGASGSSGSLITITKGADAGHAGTVYINGANLITGWTQYNGNQWEATCTTDPQWHVYFDSTQGTEETSVGNLNAANEWYWTGSTLYVYSTSDPDTAYTNPGIEAPTRTYCINTAGYDYLKFTYLNLRYARGHGLWSLNGGNSEFDNVTIEYSNSEGWIVSGSGAGDNTVTNCISHHNGHGETGCGFMITSSSSNNLIEDCEGYSNAEDGFAIGGDSAGGESNIGGTNNIFRRCNSHDNSEDGFDLKQGPNTVEYCEADNNTDNALVFHSFAENLTIRYNIFTNCQKGIYTANGYESAGGDNIYYNIIEMKSSGALSAIMLNAPGPVYLYNNVIYAPSTSANGAISITSAINNLTMKNNIVYVTGNRAIWLQSSAETYDIDNNCYYRTDAGEIWRWGGNPTSVLATWQRWSSQDVNSMKSDPTFTDAANDDFSLLVGSPCIDEGTDVSLTQDYAGTTVPEGDNPDMGAYEYIQDTIEINVELKRA